MIAAATLAIVAVVAQAVAHPERPEPNANICPGEHIYETCKACCKQYHYNTYTVQPKTYACVCDLYYNFGSAKFNGESFEDPLVAQKLQAPFEPLDDYLHEERKELKAQQSAGDSSVDQAKIASMLELLDKIEALATQLKAKAKQYYDLSN